jgi:DNA-binding GntR family transcriptional regulator
MPLVHRPERARSRNKNLAHRIVDAVRRQIIRQERLPGSKISEPMLAAERGVSRGPAREALLQLEREGLVVFDTVGRTRVVEMTQEDFEDLFELRMALEPAAVEHVTSRFDENLRRRLEANIEAMVEASSLAEVSWLDVEFHTIIMEASGRRRLIAMWRSIHSQLLLWLAALHQAHADSAQVCGITVAAHRRLMKAIGGGDARRARTTAVEQLMDWRPVIALATDTKTRKEPRR